MRLEPFLAVPPLAAAGKTAVEQPAHSLSRRHGPACGCKETQLKEGGARLLEGHKQCSGMLGPGVESGVQDFLNPWSASSPHTVRVHGNSGGHDTVLLAMFSLPLERAVHVVCYF